MPIIERTSWIRKNKPYFIELCQKYREKIYPYFTSSGDTAIAEELSKKAEMPIARSTVTAMRNELNMVNCKHKKKRGIDKVVIVEKPRKGLTVRQVIAMPLSADTKLRMLKELYPD